MHSLTANTKSPIKGLPKNQSLKFLLKSWSAEHPHMYTAVKEQELGTAAGRTAGGANRCHVVMASNLTVLVVPAALGLDGSRRNIWAQLVHSHRLGSER